MTQIMSNESKIKIPLPSAREPIDRIITEMVLEEVAMKMKMIWQEEAEVPSYIVCLQSTKEQSEVFDRMKMALRANGSWGVGP